jgi:hypothetical protein
MFFAPKGATGLIEAQGFNPGNHPNKRFALKGREMRTRLTFSRGRGRGRGRTIEPLNAYFVPGYDPPVPPGQKPFAHRRAGHPNERFGADSRPYLAAPSASGLIRVIFAG